MSDDVCLYLCGHSLRCCCTAKLKSPRGCNIDTNDASLIQGVVSKYNDMLVFGASEDRMAYTIRDPATSGVFMSQVCWQIAHRWNNLKCICELSYLGIERQSYLLFHRLPCSSNVWPAFPQIVLFACSCTSMSFKSATCILECWRVPSVAWQWPTCCMICRWNSDFVAEPVSVSPQWNTGHSWWCSWCSAKIVWWGCC